MEQIPKIQPVPLLSTFFFVEVNIESESPRSGREHIRTTPPSTKLSEKFLGAYDINILTHLPYGFLMVSTLFTCFSTRNLDAKHNPEPYHGK